MWETEYEMSEEVARAPDEADRRGDVQRVLKYSCCGQADSSENVLYPRGAAQTRPGRREGFPLREDKPNFMDF